MFSRDGVDVLTEFHLPLLRNVFALGHLAFQIFVAGVVLIAVSRPIGSLMVESGAVGVRKVECCYRCNET